MKRLIRLFSAALLASGSIASAGEPITTEPSEPPASTFKLSYEADATYEYVGGAKTRLGGDREGRVSEQYSAAHLVLTPQWNSGILYRVGFDWQRFSFGLPSGAPLPNTLQSFSAVIGADFQLFDSWLVRVEAQPGFYGDSNDLRGRDFNVPFIIGGSYIASAELQWVVGLSIDVNRRYPVIPAIGVRWQFADHWTLNAILPSPRLEYAWSKGLTLFAGGEVRDSTCHVRSDFGTDLGKPRLNNAVVEYLEVRAGAGLSWKATKELSVELQGGYLPYRDFDFHRTGDNGETQSGAPYGQLSISARF